MLATTAPTSSLAAKMPALSAKTLLVAITANAKCRPLAVSM